MADTPPTIPQVKIVDRITSVETYKKYAVYVGITLVAILLVIGGVSLWRWIFPKPEQQINKPSCIVLPGATVKKLDQSNTQVLVDEKPWEVGAGVGGFEWESKIHPFGGVWVKRKW